MAYITEIRKEKTYYAVRTEDGVYEIEKALLVQYHLEEGRETEDSLLERLHHTSRTRRAYRRACYLLDEREYSYSMLYQKLMRTYQDKELCTAVLQKLVENRLIDDRRYAERLAEYLVVRKRYGVYRARQEMLHRGLDKELVENALEPWTEEAEDNLPVVLAKKYGRILTDPKDRKSCDKAIAGMMRLGYSYRSVREAIQEYFEEQF